MNVTNRRDGLGASLRDTGALEISQTQQTNIAHGREKNIKTPNPLQMQHARAAYRTRARARRLGPDMRRLIKAIVLIEEHAGH